ncbi:threonine ammonia-lyase IlvA [Phyllobacterium sp. 0TCS1.6C]|uniref:threonine ammonia-lyase IlvA n=1 Tax=unclassified Phyllobacterium TaxID=2638441 RepID=UPI002264AD40|nr:MULTISPECIES: threonine ammonia-lyase IlvA [unclassified Phyllobacterium]MCX8282567.1 threonine ammonia-lyase IlvA [Phyllobacterium sp. 0TCS1.6C]MCX8292501.1 threonine ammonia-lyase IlvA [Phyllobacterium sp. 0TCS1.6A]
MTAFTDHVQRAADKMRTLFPETPLQLNHYLSQKYGAHIWLKREDLSPVRSYKIRGAFNFISQYLAAHRDGDASFVCASAGNHAQGFAFICRHFNRKGVVFMPVTTPQQKIDKTRSFGGEFIEIRLVGDIFDQCYAAARDYSEQTGAIMVPPFDHADIITGQATVAYEISRELPEKSRPDLMILPVGGGGLSGGVTRYLADIGWKTQFRFVEPAGAPSLKRSLEAGKRVRLDAVDNFVDGAAVGEIGKENFKLLKHFRPEDVTLIPENRLSSTILEMLNIEGIVVEPAGALAIDALKDFKKSDLRGKHVVLVISGSNFDFERLPELKERSQRYEGLKKYFIFRFPQRPGALRSFLDLLGPEDDVARFEYLKKSARNFGSVLIGIETRHRSNFDALFKRFDEAGWAYQDITENDAIAGLII